MTFVYESKLRKDNIVYDKEVGLQHEIEQAFQNPSVKRSFNSSSRSSPDSNHFCCSCMEIIAGSLYNCSRCDSSFHSICHFPALPIDKGNSSSDWMCHRCKIEIQYNRRHLPRIKCNSNLQEKEDTLNQSFIRFLLRLSGKDGVPSEDFSEFVNSLKAINSREFTLEKLCVDECFYKLPFDELFTNDEHGIKKCFYCKRFVEKKMISCDFCDASFCSDCPNPPFTALPNERFMCSLHIEPFIDANFLSTKRITDRMALWKKYTELSRTSFRSIISSFYKKIEAEKQLTLDPVTTTKKRKPMKAFFKIDDIVKRSYALAEQDFCGESRKCRGETPIDVGSPGDARLSIAVEALIKMHNQSDASSGRNFGADNAFFSESNDGDQSLQYSYNPALFHMSLPIFASIKILSGADKNINESRFLIPIHSSFVTLGPLEMQSVHNVDLGQFTHCKLLWKYQALIFFDKAKLCFEIVSANLFDEDFFPTSHKWSQQTAHSNDAVLECSCSNMEANTDSPLQLFAADEVVPTRKSAVLWNGAIIRIGCLRLHFVGLGIL